MVSTDGGLYLSRFSTDSISHFFNFNHFKTLEILFTSLLFYFYQGFNFMLHCWWIYEFWNGTRTAWTWRLNLKNSYLPKFKQKPKKEAGKVSKMGWNLYLVLSSNYELMNWNFACGCLRLGKFQFVCKMSHKFNEWDNIWICKFVGQHVQELRLGFQSLTLGRCAVLNSKTRETQDLLYLKHTQCRT